jgi:hypothetical protein
MHIKKPKLSAANRCAIGASITVVMTLAVGVLKIVGGMAHPLA